MTVYNYNMYNKIFKKKSITNTSHHMCITWCIQVNTYLHARIKNHLRIRWIYFQKAYEYAMYFSPTRSTRRKSYFFAIGAAKFEFSDRRTVFAANVVCEWGRCLLCLSWYWYCLMQHLRLFTCKLLENINKLFTFMVTTLINKTFEIASVCQPSLWEWRAFVWTAINLVVD